MIKDIMVVIMTLYLNSEILSLFIKNIIDVCSRILVTHVYIYNCTGGGIFT